MFHVEEELFVLDKTDRIARILDAKYKPANLKELMANLPQLISNQQEQVYQCLNKRTALFNGTLDLWKGEPYKIELQDGVQPHHTKPCRVPQTYAQTFKQEVERLCNI